jgi:hypothetical protein
MNRGSFLYQASDEGEVSRRKGAKLASKGRRRRGQEARENPSGSCGLDGTKIYMAGGKDDRKRTEGKRGQLSKKMGGGEIEPGEGVPTKQAASKVYLRLAIKGKP